MTELYDHIAATIRALRQGRGWSQEELAKKTQTTGNTISRWETGTYKPTAEELDRLARVFSVSISVFFLGTDQSNEIPPTAQALLSATKGLDEGDMDEILRYAEFRRARNMLTQAKSSKKSRLK